MVLMKKYGVWLALLFTLAATVWVSKQDALDDLVVTTGGNAKVLKSESEAPRTQKNVRHAMQDNQPMLVVADGLMQRSLDNDVSKNIFTPFTTVQNKPELNATSANTLPANPFIYAGKIIEDGALVVFLIDGEKSHAVKSGDVIEDTWAIKSITPPTMRLKYIPLKIEIQMEIGVNS
jgi:exopolysaccharide biosynthesis protein